MEEEVLSHAVRVAVRVRPPLESEARQPLAVSYPSAPQVMMPPNRAFTFDYVFREDSSQRLVYEQAVTPLAKAFFEGYNATVLAYGQTGSGKTYTMGTVKEHPHSDNLIGVLPRFAKDLFQYVSAAENEDKDFNLRVSFLEIHNEEIHDLLNPCEEGLEKPISIRETADGQVVPFGVIEQIVSSEEELIRYLEEGSEYRATGPTMMNVQSSRSHAIFTVILTQKKRATLKDVLEPEEVICSKFHFVDLAGSERLKRTQAVGETMKEGININCGLLALGNVISALGDPKRKATHVPFRESKITRLLQDSLGGNSQTLMIACISPAEINIDESLNTLRYANRARNIENKPIINRDADSAKFIELQNEVLALRKLLEEHGVSIHSSANKSIDFRMTQRQQDLEDEVTRLSERNKILHKDLSDKEEQLFVVQKKVWELVQRGTISNQDLESVDISLDEFSVFQDLNSRMKQLEEQLDKREEDIINLQMEETDLNVNLDDNSPEQDHVEKEIQAFHESSEKLDSEVSSLEEILKRKQEELDELRRERKMAEMLRNKYERKILELESEKKLVFEKFQSLEAASEKTLQNNDVAKYQDKLKQLNDKIQKYKEKLKEKETLIRSKLKDDHKLHQLEREVDQIKNERIRMKKQIKDENQKHRLLVQDMQREQKVLQKKSRQQELTISKLSLKLQALERKAQKMKDIPEASKHYAGTYNKNFKNVFPKEVLQFLERSRTDQFFDAESQLSNLRLFLKKLGPSNEDARWGLVWLVDILSEHYRSGTPPVPVTEIRLPLDPSSFKGLVDYPPLENSAESETLYPEIPDNPEFELWRQGQSETIQVRRAALAKRTVDKSKLRRDARERVKERSRVLIKDNQSAARVEKEEKSKQPIVTSPMTDKTWFERLSHPVNFTGTSKYGHSRRRRSKSLGFMKKEEVLTPIKRKVRFAAVDDTALTPSSSRTREELDSSHALFSPRSAPSSMNAPNTVVQSTPVSILRNSGSSSKKGLRSHLSEVLG